MSADQWERGEITLPAKGARQIRTALAEEHERSRAAVLAEVDRFLVSKGAGGRTPQSFREALNSWAERRHRELSAQVSRSSWLTDPGGNQRTAIEMQRGAVGRAHEFLSGRGRQGQFTKPTATELKQAFPPAPKGTSVSYRMPEAVVVVNGRRLRWQVHENNHAVDAAHEHPMAQRLFMELDKVEWTAGTGGMVRQYDENQDYGDGYGDEDGGIGPHFNAGGVRASRRYGPQGDPNFVTKAQQTRLDEAAKNWRRRSPANAGRCGQPTMQNGRRVGPPCRKPSLTCPDHGRGAAR